MASFFLVNGPPTVPAVDFGLCARAASAVFPTLRPRSLFPTGQRFPIPNHVTPELAIPFPDWSAVSHLKSRDFRFP